MKRWLIVAALAIVLTAAFAQAQCYTFYEGLCPGADNCMCTMGESCSGSSSGSSSAGDADHAAGLARATAADGSCAGSCQYVQTGECPGDSSCLMATGSCGGGSSSSGSGSHTVPPAPAPPSPSNSSVIQCAQTWVNEQIPYCQCTGSAECCGTCPYCGTYRCDCSGYVSYCLGLSYGYTTDTLPQVTTQISQSELVPGDIMLCIGTHVVFFAGWTDESMTNYVCYQEPGCHTTGPHHAMVSVEPYPMSWNPTCFQPYAPNSGEGAVQRLRHKMESDGVIVAKKHDDKKCNKKKGGNPHIAPRWLVEQAAQTQRSYPPEHETEALAAAEKVREHLAGMGIKAGF